MTENNDLWMICDRCDRNILPDLLRYLDEGGPDQCARCTLRLPVPPRQWARENGYETYDEAE